jgi:hypothetical protein
MTTAASDNTDKWGTIALPGSMTTRLVSPPTWRVSHISVFAAFLASVLIQFISFGDWVG